MFRAAEELLTFDSALCHGRAAVAKAGKPGVCSSVVVAGSAVLLSGSGSAIPTARPTDSRVRSHGVGSCWRSEFLRWQAKIKLHAGKPDYVTHWWCSLRVYIGRLRALLLGRFPLPKLATGPNAAIRYLANTYGPPSGRERALVLSAGVTDQASKAEVRAVPSEVFAGTH